MQSSNKILLADDEPPAVELFNGQGNSSVVLLCDHASNRVPKSLSMLGLGPEQLDDHIGWDPGAADVARHMAVLLDAPLLLSGYSRLVVDCNRPLHSPGLIPEQSADVVIPGNQHLSTDERELRVSTFFQPYHDAIDANLQTRGRKPTLLISVHSFTPCLNGNQRPWHIGVAYRRDDRLASALYQLLIQKKSITVGFNEPYRIEDDYDYSIPTHGENRGLPCAMMEIRQDQINTKIAAERWAAYLAEVVTLATRKLL